jgi:hypothetical protein
MASRLPLSCLIFRNAGFSRPEAIANMPAKASAPFPFITPINLMTHIIRKTAELLGFSPMPLRIGPNENGDEWINPISLESTTRPLLSPAQRAGYWIAKLSGGPTGSDTAGRQPPVADLQAANRFFCTDPARWAGLRNRRTFGPEETQSLTSCKLKPALHFPHNSQSIS